MHPIGILPATVCTHRGEHGTAMAHSAIIHGARIHMHAQPARALQGSGLRIPRMHTRAHRSAGREQDAKSSYNARTVSSQATGCCQS